MQNKDLNYVPTKAQREILDALDDPNDARYIEIGSLTVWSNETGQAVYSIAAPHIVRTLLERRWIESGVALVKGQDERIGVYMLAGHMQTPKTFVRDLDEAFEMAVFDDADKRAGMTLQVAPTTSRILATALKRHSRQADIVSYILNLDVDEMNSNDLRSTLDELFRMARHVDDPASDQAVADFERAAMGEV